MRWNPWHSLGLWEAQDSRQGRPGARNPIRTNGILQGEDLLGRSDAEARQGESRKFATLPGPDREGVLKGLQELLQSELLRLTALVGPRLDRLGLDPQVCVLFFVQRLGARIDHGQADDPVILGGQVQ